MEQFDCEQYLDVCGARCCSCFPMDPEIYKRNKDKVCRTIAEKQKVKLGDKELLIVLTHSMLCVFLGDDFKCNIYEERPQICHQFGDEKFPFMHCPFQHTDGSPREPVDS